MAQVWGIGELPKHVLIQHSTGRWGFVGTVDGRLAYIGKDGSPATEAQLKSASQCGPGFVGLKTRTWETQAEAEAAAAEIGAPISQVSAYQGTITPPVQSFTDWIAEIALAHGKTSEQVTTLWKEYAEQCHSGDQSPVRFEFLDWYKDRLAEPVAPPPPTPRPLGLDGLTGVVVSENAAKGGIEIRFPAKPEAAVLGRLKANGWRWSRFSSCWYHLKTDAAVRLASEIAGVEVAAAGPSGEDGPCSDAGYEDQCRERCGL